MCKDILISVQPKWCEKIAHGKKTIEVRKNRPKIQTPFKCYIYCTLPPDSELFTHGGIRDYANTLIRLQSGEIVYDYGMRVCCDPEHRPFSKDNFLCQKVIGEFVCDDIYEYHADEMPFGEYEIDDDSATATCLRLDEFWAYGKGATLYGWHISDLVIYDRPKDLDEFHYAAETIKRRTKGNTWIKVSDLDDGIKRPPQSWCYVEEA